LTKGRDVADKPVLTNEEIYELAPFARLLGVEFDELSPESVKARLPYRPELATMGGAMHGGALMGLADLSIATCVGLNIKPGYFMTTAESTTYFLRAVRGGSAISIARPVKVGSSLVVAEADIYSDNGTHCARVCQAVAVLAPR
jgi:1,4-dihydroxy-2-naphthoyl-CoA hydrolase